MQLGRREVFCLNCSKQVDEACNFKASFEDAILTLDANQLNSTSALQLNYGHSSEMLRNFYACISNLLADRARACQSGRSGKP
jgi:hypothetical protein